MRPRILATLLVLAIVTAGALAATGSAEPNALGDGCLVVKQGYGKVVVTLTRGVVLGRFQEGSVSYSDTDGDATSTNLPKVPGVTPTKLGDHLWKFGPAVNVRFRSSGPTKLIVNAQLIDLSVAGKGTATVWTNGFIQEFAGQYSVDDDSFCEAGFKKMPLAPTKVQISSPIAG
jgi:hypothetical protein